MKKIVLIEDDKLIVTIIEFILKKEGYTVLSANDGNEGLKIIEEVKPDLILTDVMLTYKSGLEVASISKKKFPLIPIIIITALERKEEKIKEAFKIGVNGYISKPIEHDELLTLIQSYFKNWFFKSRQRNTTD